MRYVLRITGKKENLCNFLCRLSRFSLVIVVWRQKHVGVVIRQALLLIFQRTLIILCSVSYCPITHLMLKRESFICYTLQSLPYRWKQLSVEPITLGLLLLAQWISPTVCRPSS